jgi:hypothetical protein
MSRMLEVNRTYQLVSDTGESSRDTVSETSW